MIHFSGRRSRGRVVKAMDSKSIGVSPRRDETLSPARVFEWHERFSRVRDNEEDDELGAQGQCLQTKTVLVHTPKLKCLRNGRAG
ncbi:hypothetical protein TNCV_3001351 [Trichonephila clavipes]|nr:hypothetical protein TNCV_3001351 [Trichonephila clavipes]